MMKHPSRWIRVGLLVAAGCGSDPASKPGSTDLLPLEIGYTWVYTQRLPDGSTRTVEDAVVSVREVDGLRYFRVEGPLLGSLIRDERPNSGSPEAWIRSTPTAVYVRFDERDESLLFADLSLSPGTGFDFAGMPARRDADRERVVVPVGTFLGVPSFSYDLDLADGGYGMSLVPGVGVVRGSFITIAGQHVFDLAEAPTRLP